MTGFPIERHYRFPGVAVRVYSVGQAAHRVAHDDEARMAQRKLGKYEVSGTLGRGAMGIVYEGWDPIISRRVAIKTVRLPESGDSELAESLARFKREAQAAGRLNHPNIVGVFDYGETDEIAYIVMEFIDGNSLKELLDSGEHLVPAEIVRVMTSLLAGLQYSHDRGVVHRDIKPANIMLTSQGQVKIADFGIARIESSNMTQAGAVMGTPAYMSPEQFIGQTVDRRTDIYSAGVVLYQMVTGDRPFDGGMSAIMHKAINIEPPRPSELSVAAPAALDAVVAKAMAKRPENRFDTADAFARALGAAFATSATPAAGDVEATIVNVRGAAPSVAASGEPVSPAMAKSSPRRGWSGPILALGVLMFLAAGGGAAWYLRGQHLPPKQAELDVAQTSPPIATNPDTTPPAATPPTTPAEIAPSATTQPGTTLAETASTTQAQTVPAEVPLENRVDAPPQSPLMPAPSASVLPDAPPPVAPPAQTAMNSPAVNASPPKIELAEARALAREIPCSALQVTGATTPYALRVSGPALSGARLEAFVRRLRADGRQIDVATDKIVSGLCPAISTLADLLRRDRDHGALRLVAPDGPVPSSGRLALTVQSVPSGSLYVDLYAADGSVQHLLHRVISPDTNGTDVAVAASVLGPPGQRLLVAITTPAADPVLQRPASESASTYLPILQGDLARTAPDGAGAGIEIAMLTVSGALPRPPQAAITHPRTPSLNGGRCADIVARFQLGEVLSDADRAALRTSCGQ